ncbi:hypothetical protein E2C01_090556 [Portunus trituberculatus]|uniref:Uncharacterized protein n=1 Tax=Portunus trituberculatus TaxID=210409 RepID=A0A5B7JKH1_PORTR|nr:hypothetical protein [Portunus trituberculatus]
MQQHPVSLQRDRGMSNPAATRAQLELVKSSQFCLQWACWSGGVLRVPRWGLPWAL